MAKINYSKRNGKLTRVQRLVNFYQREQKAGRAIRKYHLSTLMRVLECDETTTKRTITGMNTKGFIHTVKEGRGYYFV